VTRQGGRRLTPAHDDHASACGDLGERYPDDLVQCGIGWGFLVIVEDHGEGDLQSPVELAEIAPREDVQPVPILGHQERE
jgi:hypothetical protein